MGYYENYSRLRAYGATAGIAAVHSIRENRAVGEIDYSALKAELEKENVTF